MEGRGNAEDEEDPFGRGKSRVAWVGMSRWGGGEFSPLWGNCCVELRSGPTHDLFRCFPCTFGTLLVHSVLSLYTQCFSFTLLVCSTLWHLGVLCHDQGLDIGESPFGDILRAKVCTRVYTVVYRRVYYSVHTCTLLPP